MFNSILQFQENGINELAKVSGKFYDNPEDFTKYELGITENVLKLGCQIIEDDLNHMNEAIKNSTFRKQSWNVVRTDRATLITGIGSVTYNKTLFINKKTNERSYLIDRLIKKPANERLSIVAEANIYKEVVDSSYRKGGSKISLADSISAQAVKAKIHSLEFPEYETPSKKKIEKNIYIDADEDHVSLQKETGVDADGNEYRTKGCLSKIVYTYTGKTNIGNKVARNKLDNAHYFCGVNEGTKKNKELWSSVNDFLISNYDEEEVEHIFVNGDGGGWIKTAETELGSKCVMVIDAFHLQKYIHSATSHMGDSVEDSRSELNKAIANLNVERVEEIFGILIDFADKETVKNRIQRSYDFLVNHWKWIENSVTYKEVLLGCSAEGHVSHILSDRLSSRPLGWSKVGADKMSMLRAYRANGSDMLSLAQYQRMKKRIAPIDKKICSASDIMASEKSAKNATEKYWGLVNKGLCSQQIAKMAGIKLRVTGL